MGVGVGGEGSVGRMGVGLGGRGPEVVGWGRRGRTLGTYKVITNTHEPINAK